MSTAQTQINALNTRYFARNELPHLTSYRHFIADSAVRIRHSPPGKQAGKIYDFFESSLPNTGQFGTAMVGRLIR
jgi:hypothetical protein